MKAIAIDLGSSFVKYAIFELENGMILNQKKIISIPKRNAQDRLVFEIPVMGIVKQVKEILAQETQKYDDIGAMIFSTQMHGFVYRTEGEQEPVYVSWQDMRCLHQRKTGETYLEYLQGLFSKEDMKECGVYIKPSLGLCNLFTMLDENPARPRNGTLYTLGSFVIEQLTGNNICHITNAAPLGLADVTRHCWSEKIIKRAGFDEIKFPKIAESDFSSCGVYEVNGSKLQVFPDYGDQQIAVLGSMSAAGEGLINIATAGQVSVIAEEFQAGDFENRPYFEKLYLRTISNMPSGRGLDVLVRFAADTVERLTNKQMGIGEFWKILEKQFEPDTKGIQVDMSFYETPWKLDGGEIRGIKPGNLNLNTLFSAAFRDMAETYKKNLDILSQNTPLKAVVCSGGVSWKRPELIRVIQTVMGCPCRLSALDDEAVAGLYRMALCCSGLYKSLADQGEQVLKIQNME